MGGKNWSDKEINILKNHYGKMSSSDLQQIFLPSRSISSIQNKIRRIGLSKYPIYYKLEINKNTTYFLGLLAADGWLRKQSYRTSIRLKQEDGYILKRLHKILKIGNISEINKTPPLTSMTDLTICNKLLFGQIVSLGITPKKTFTLKWPNIPEELNRDFIRGYFDGDGCITYSKSHKAYKSSIVGSSKDMLSEIMNILKKEAGLRGGGIYKKSSSRTCYALMYAKNDTIKLGEWMYYPGCIRMKRKYKLFLKTPGSSL